MLLLTFCCFCKLLGLSLGNAVCERAEHRHARSFSSGHRVRRWSSAAQISSIALPPRRAREGTSARLTSDAQTRISRRGRVKTGDGQPLYASGKRRSPARPRDCSLSRRLQALSLGSPSLPTTTKIPQLFYFSFFSSSSELSSELLHSFDPTLVTFCSPPTQPPPPTPRHDLPYSRPHRHRRFLACHHLRHGPRRLLLVHCAYASSARMSSE